MDVFKFIENGILERRYGFKVGEHFVVSYRNGSWWVYVIHSGKKFVKFSFSSKEIGVQFAEIMENIYGKFMWILLADDWKDSDIPTLVQWTVQCGIAMAHTLQCLNDDEARMSNLYLINKACEGN